jgi:nicotinate-nucleotide pyrophosphorylase (carboxylating)
MSAYGLPADVDAVVARALAEDVGTGDLTAALVPADEVRHGSVITRESAVLCGTAWFEACFRALDPQIRIEWHCQDGDRVAHGQSLCSVEGPARGLLTGERTALNFLQTLSGTATATRRYVEIVAGTNCRILDTRKTLPGLRSAQKYAVRCGGGTNHRLGLYDGILIKENHIVAAGSIAAAVAAARKVAQTVLVEIEVENLGEFETALATDVDRIMLDEFDLEAMRAAVRRAAERSGRRVELEASGNVTVETLRAVAETGVDFVSIGAITKHVRAVDLSMRLAARG